MSNALMVLVTLVIFLLINAVVIKVYFESIEQELGDSIGTVMDEDGLDEEAYLESAGFQTVIVAKGTEVSSLLQKESFDLILLD